MATLSDFESICPGMKPHHIEVLIDSEYNALTEEEKKTSMSITYFIANFNSLKTNNAAYFITENAEQYIKDNEIILGN